MSQDLGPGAGVPVLSPWSSQHDKVWLKSGGTNGDLCVTSCSFPKECQLSRPYENATKCPTSLKLSGTLVRGHFAPRSRYSVGMQPAVGGRLCLKLNTTKQQQRFVSALRRRLKGDSKNLSCGCCSSPPISMWRR